MKELILIIFALVSSAVTAAEIPPPKANALVDFLTGDWENVSFEISAGKPIKREAYSETMVAKDFDALTITAHGFKDGKDLTKEMRLKLRGDKLTLTQGSFVAKGKREDQVFNLRGAQGDAEYRFRLYTLGDKYVFHRETWKSGKIQQIDMSYLERKSEQNKAHDRAN